MTNFEVITTTDKDVRDRLFQDLRKNGTSLEKQVVKFSSNQLKPGLLHDGEPRFRTVRYSKTGKVYHRPVYESTWSVAYPTKEDSNPSRRRNYRGAGSLKLGDGVLPSNLKEGA